MTTRAETPATPEAYLASLPDDRRAVMSAVRDVIRRHLPPGYAEVVSSGMLTYCVPLERSANTYNKQPLWYAALAAQKNYYALHLMSVYSSQTQLARLRAAFAKAGKKLDMGKACIRFKQVEDLPLDAIGELIASVPMEQWIAVYEDSRRKR